MNLALVRLNAVCPGYVLTEQLRRMPEAIHQRLCLDGVGVAILAHRLVTDAVTKKQLVHVLPEWLPSPWSSTSSTRLGSV